MCVVRLDGSSSFRETSQLFRLCGLRGSSLQAVQAYAKYSRTGCSNRVAHVYMMHVCLNGAATVCPGVHLLSPELYDFHQLNSSRELAVPGTAMLEQQNSKLGIPDLVVPAAAMLQQSQVAAFHLCMHVVCRGCCGCHGWFWCVPMWEPPPAVMAQSQQTCPASCCCTLATI